ncbi:MAG: patatin-like phospholipase family protein [Vulcanimicrobiaceae bacterium]
MQRARFLGVMAAGSVLAMAPRAVSAAVPLADRRFERALVLSGGGARGAYEAGVIASLVRAAGVRDGERLPSVDAVLGTSIGALNGWFVATGQYSALESVWFSIANESIFRLKPRYASIPEAESGVGTRIFEFFSLLHGITNNVTGVLDSEPVERWIKANVDPKVLPIVPFGFNATNLETQAATYFYVMPNDVTLADKAEILDALTVITGLDHKAFAANARRLRTALRASAALPALFDPVKMVLDGHLHTFVDGGIADNSPVDIGRVVAKAVDVILVDPKDAVIQTQNALQIGLASYGILQRRTLELSMRTAYVETLQKRLFVNGALNPIQRTYIDNIFDVDLRVLRPTVELAITTADFDDGPGIQAAYAQGKRDGVRGWAPYTPPKAILRLAGNAHPVVNRSGG